MASQMVSVRFPTGESEFRITAEPPEVGDTFKRGDAEWRVSYVDADENERAVVTLVAVEAWMTPVEVSGVGTAADSHA
jgi:hypothetical protein